MAALRQNVAERRWSGLRGVGGESGHQQATFAGNEYRPDCGQSALMQIFWDVSLHYLGCAYPRRRRSSDGDGTAWSGCKADRQSFDPQETPESLEDKLAKEAARMKRKGWSNTKIARALEDQRKADAKPIRGGLDSLELWSTILLDLRNELKLPYAGLFIRFYSGAIDTETFTASRREVLTGLSWQEALAALKEDEVTIFR
eukprot:gene9872-13280_t